LSLTVNEALGYAPNHRPRHLSLIHLRNHVIRSREWRPLPRSTAVCCASIVFLSGEASEGVLIVESGIAFCLPHPSDEPTWDTDSPSDRSLPERAHNFSDQSVLHEAFPVRIDAGAHDHQIVARHNSDVLALVAGSGERPRGHAGHLVEQPELRTVAPLAFDRRLARCRCAVPSSRAAWVGKFQTTLLYLCHTTTAE
jgi:hypothetical protein